VETGIQAVSEVEPKTNLDAGVRRHDELSVDHPERENYTNEPKVIQFSKLAAVL
jgi:hypothetical protein